MSNEGNKTVLISMPYSLWEEMKEFIYFEKISMAAWIRELIKNELNKQKRE